MYSFSVNVVQIRALLLIYRANEIVTPEKGTTDSRANWIHNVSAVFGEGV